MVLNAPVVDDDVAMFINITNMCKSLGTLPRSGGLLDQDSYMIYGIQTVLEGMAERERLDAEKQKQEAKKTRRR